jgi:hypothetical protein
MQSFRNIVLLVLAGSSLAACSSSLTGLSSGTPSLAPAVSNASYAPQTLNKQNVIARPSKPVSIALAPIVGPPSNVAKKLNVKIVSELKRRNINVIKGKTHYKMRGYVVSSSEGNSAKLAYIWDLNNKAGRRQTRITGEKSVYNDKGANPWKGVNDKVISAIAKDTANQLAGWMAKKNGGTVATQKLRANRIPRSSRAPSITASTGKSKRVIMAMVVPVTGAPGDGKTSLTKAIKKRLYSKGIRLTSSRTSSVYQVRGVVQVGKTAKGKQPIRIDWRVYDPKGKRLGTVTQKNEIPQGSLNGSWGAIADAAAGAAAEGITKLLPKSTRRL